MNTPFTSEMHTQALQDAYRELLAGLLTEPMTVSELATEYFHVGRNKMTAILRHMEGVERCGRLVRVPVWKMPPAYLARHNLIPLPAPERPFLRVSA